MGSVRGFGLRVSLGGCWLLGLQPGCRSAFGKGTAVDWQLACLLSGRGGVARRGVRSHGPRDLAGLVLASVANQHDNRQAGQVCRQRARNVVTQLRHLLPTNRLLVLRRGSPSRPQRPTLSFSSPPPSALARQTHKGPSTPPPPPTLRARQPCGLPSVAWPLHPSIASLSLPACASQRIPRHPHLSHPPWNAELIHPPRHPKLDTSSLHHVCRHRSAGTRVPQYAAPKAPSLVVSSCLTRPGPFTVEVSQVLTIKNPNATPVAFKVARP